jgi:hypothetical protein
MFLVGTEDVLPMSTLSTGLTIETMIQDVVVCCINYYRLVLLSIFVDHIKIGKHFSI